MVKSDKITNRYSLLDHLGTGILLIDRDYSVLFWNSVMEDWTGTSREEAITTDLRILIPSVENCHLSSRIDAMLNGLDHIELSSNVSEGDIPLLNSDGRILAHRVFISPVPGSGGTGRNVVFQFLEGTDRASRCDDMAAGKDVPGQERAEPGNPGTDLDKETANGSEVEERLARYAIELERTNRNLDRNRRDLEELMSSTPRDLKESLVSMNGFSRLIRQRLAGTLDNRTSDYLDRIMQSTMRMERLLADIMEISNRGFCS